MGDIFITSATLMNCLPLWIHVQDGNHFFLLPSANPEPVMSFQFLPPVMGSFPPLSKLETLDVPGRSALLYPISNHSP